MEIISNLIYFNNNGTTVSDPEVTQAMAEFTTKLEADRSVLNAALNQARQQIAALLNCAPQQLFFTKSTSDGINLGIKSAYRVPSKKGNHIITNSTEHPAILKACKELEKEGASITYLDVDREGLIDPEALKAAIGKNTVLVSIMAANNETGVLQPIEQISRICRDHDLIFFSDGSQYVGKMHCDVSDLDFDLLAFSAHKIHGPKDVGVLYVKEPGKFENIASTIDENSAEGARAVIGMGKMAEIISRDHWENSSHVSRIKNYFEHQLLDIEGLRINGSTRNRLYNTSNIQFPSDKVSQLSSTYKFSHNASSHVLKAMGLTEEEIKNSFRFSFGKYNSIDEVKLLTEQILNLMSNQTPAKN